MQHVMRILLAFLKRKTQQRMSGLLGNGLCRPPLYGHYGNKPTGNGLPGNGLCRPPLYGHYGNKPTGNELPGNGLCRPPLYGHYGNKPTGNELPGNESGGPPPRHPVVVIPWLAMLGL